ncbi:MAG TPA: hypothetical protein VGQ59_12540 [Cyclobacteriaceae bacterium]|jgi:hypothetical protein|nr:hypothetical protein [Cyclobacteriaceae bacterium]
MNTFASWIPIASTFSVLAPLFLLLRNFKNYNLEIKALAFFLSFGFLVDVGTWYFYNTKNNSVLYGIHNVYDLFEAGFLFWFLGKVSPLPRVRRFLLNSWIILVPFWAMRFINPDWFSWFKTCTQIFIAFASCFFILRLVEKTEDISRNLIVWVLLGIFFYCFSTYFILALVSIFFKAWYSHNLANITTNLIYFIGFVRSKNELTEKA